MRRAIFDLKTRVAQRGVRRTAVTLQAAETMSARTCHDLQNSRMVTLVQHAFTTTDYYRERFTEAGFSEEDLAVAENLNHLPRLRKADIREAGEALFSRALTDRHRLPSRTGGSTGVPLSVYNDRAAPTAALWWRVYRWWGVHPADNVAFIYRQSRAGMAAVRYATRWWPTRHLLLDARNTTPGAIEAFCRQWQHLRPRLLVGYVEGVYDFARYLHETGTTVHRPHAISVTASGLQPGQRDFIQRVLEAPVYDTYRSAEIPWIAAECHERQGLHVQADIRKLELLTDADVPANPGQTANVVLSDLTNFAFPLIRYDIGDRARPVGGPCKCGNTLPRIGPLEGRQADVMYTPSGRHISGGYGGLFNRWPESIQQFQLHQSTDYSITVRFVPAADRKAADRAARNVAATISNFMNHEVPVVIEAVDRIPHDGGKTRLVTSDVTASDYVPESRK